MAIDRRVQRAVTALRTPDHAFARVPNTVRQALADLIEELTADLVEKTDPFGDELSHHDLAAMRGTRMDRVSEEQPQVSDMWAALQKIDGLRYQRRFHDEPWQLSDYGNAYSCGSQAAFEECSDIARSALAQVER